MCYVFKINCNLKFPSHGQVRGIQWQNVNNPANAFLIGKLGVFLLFHSSVKCCVAYQVLK